MNSTWVVVCRLQLLFSNPTNYLIHECNEAAKTIESMMETINKSKENTSIDMQSRIGHKKKYRAIHLEYIAHHQSTKKEI